MTLFVEMACNGMFGTSSTGMIQPPDPDRTFTFRTAHIARFDREYYDLYLDFVLVSDIAKHQPETLRGKQALRAANAAINRLHVEDRTSWAGARALLREFLAHSNGSSVGVISAVGHCHIDTAWLWPYAETRRKCARSWATQVGVMGAVGEIVTGGVARI